MSEIWTPETCTSCYIILVYFVTPIVVLQTSSNKILLSSLLKLDSTGRKADVWIAHTGTHFANTKRPDFFLANCSACNLLCKICLIRWRFFSLPGARSVCFASQLCWRAAFRWARKDCFASCKTTSGPRTGIIDPLTLVSERYRSCSKSRESCCCRGRRERKKQMRSAWPGSLAGLLACWAAEWKRSVKKDETTCAGRCGRALREGHFYGTSFTKPEPLNKIQPRKSRFRRDLLHQRDTSFAIAVVILKHRCRLLLHV